MRKITSSRQFDKDWKKLNSKKIVFYHLIERKKTASVILRRQFLVLNLLTIKD